MAGTITRVFAAIPSFPTLINPHTFVGEGFGAAIHCLAMMWTVFTSLWFWAVGYWNLPLLGTADKTWFFVNVDITGGYRLFMLSYENLNSVAAILIFVSTVRMVYIATLMWWQGATEIPDWAFRLHPDSDSWFSKLRFTTRLLCIYGAIFWALAIACIEETIKINDLTPETNLAALTIGIVQLIDGSLCLLRPNDPDDQ